jgi:hypothetical protein
MLVQTVRRGAPVIWKDAQYVDATVRHVPLVGFSASEQDETKRKRANGFHPHGSLPAALGQDGKSP